MDVATRILLAAITEGLMIIISSSVVIALYIRYAQRRKTAALSLAVAFTFWAMAVTCLFIFRVLDYLNLVGILNSTIDLSGVGINLGYGFSALSNIFILTFVAIVFTQSAFFRRTGMLMPIIFAVANGLTIGLLIGNTVSYWPEPEYGLSATVYHLILTLISFTSLIVFTRKPLREAELRWEKAGFQFIINSGIFGILVYVFFVVDLILGDMLGVIVDGYTPFFYLAYLCAILMCLFAYMGYVMPNYIRKWFPERSAENTEKSF